MANQPAQNLPNIDLGEHQSLWKEHLELQTKILESVDAKHLFPSNIWQSARKVLDMGCGEGSHLLRIQSQYPDKSYTGIDVDKDVISMAQAKTSEILFLLKDIYSYTPTQEFDFAIARLLIQHLPNLDGFLGFAQACLNPGGTLWVVDGYDELKRIGPKAPLLKAAYDELAKAQKQRGTDRNGSLELVNLAHKHDFRVEQEIIEVLYAERDFSRQVLKRLYEVNTRVIKDRYSLPLDLNAIYAQLDEWALDDAPSTIGVHILTLQKI
ncbi:MAG: hypothetical protein DRR19_23795 [Candidatus Parabeggiatoa sp. nov. 1]|nr:MAG: hypothetical protein DRR19_23795 [Gammaproteobacteria bacterium]